MVKDPRLHSAALRRICGRFALCFTISAAAMGQAPVGGASATSAKARVRPVKNLRVTPVEGESWLRHLGIPFVGSNMGRAGRWGFPPPESDRPFSPQGPDGDFVVSGADLYRLNCRSCHKADGTGVPPEINSLVGPVQATSPVMIRAQMKARGIELDAKAVNQLVSQAQTALRTRLQNGGEKMPPFAYLAPEEVEALTAYLGQLAGIPGAERNQIWLSEPAVRVGEHLIKGTCHTCHEATGPGVDIGTPGMPAVIPSLANVQKELIQSQVIRKVREGLSIPMPMLTTTRGQMPLFTDISPEEIAAAYAYVTSYPPRSGGPTAPVPRAGSYFRGLPRYFVAPSR